MAVAPALKFTFSNLPGVGWKLSARKIADLAALCDEVGFDRFAVADLTYHYDCVAVMTACLLATKRLCVESLVTSPYMRDPGLLAMAWATLADLSGGRAILGIGGGGESGSRPWVEPWGHQRPHRVSAVREAITVVRGMWHGEKVTLDGTVVHVHNAALDCPLPPHIPVLVAARGRQMLGLAGELADIAHLASLLLNREHQLENLALVRAGAVKAGRADGTYEVDLSVTLSVSNDPARARSEARRNAAQTIAWMTLDSRKPGGQPLPPELGVPAALAEGLVTRWDVWKDMDIPTDLEAMITDTLLEQFAVFGTPAECATRLRRLVESLPGVTGVRVKLPRPVRSATYGDYEEAITGIGAVIGVMRQRQPALA